MSAAALEPVGNGPASLRVLIVEDHPIVAQGYLHLLARVPTSSSAAPPSAQRKLYKSRRRRIPIWRSSISRWQKAAVWN